MTNDEGFSRREFAGWIGAIIAAAGVAGCGKPPREKIVPYARQPEGEIPGKPLFYATARPASDGAMGLLVRNDSGRPTKVEGNPRHPASLGATDPASQAEIFALWDPDRSQAVLKAGLPSAWPDFLAALNAALEGPRGRHGEGLRILTESVLSPTLAGQLDRLLRDLPGARRHVYDSAGRDAVLAGSRLAFGAAVEPLYRLDQAEVVVALDADLLCRPRDARDFAAQRRAGPGRLYAVEPMPTATGAAADHRWPVRACELEAVAKELARALGVPLGPAPERTRFDWIPTVARDLQRRPGSSLVAAGPGQPALVHALAAAMNQALGNMGRTLRYIEPPAWHPEDGRDSLAALTADMAAGRVEVLLLLGGNPVHAAPADLEFAEALARVRFRVHLGPSVDESAWLCHWHVPESHFLESWSDARAYDGTASIVQPLIAPLYESRSAHELVSALQGEPGKSAHDLVRGQWRAGRDAKEFEAFWQTALHEGVVEGTASPPRAVAPRLDAIRGALPAFPIPEGIELVFRPDPTIGDGRGSNNPWLQELPKPLTKLTWDNAAMIGFAAAARLGLTSGDEVEISLDGRSLQAPVWVVPGHADQSITLHLGYGRSRAGRFGSGRGVRAEALRSRPQFAFGTGAALRKTGRKRRLACTQGHHEMEGRDPARVTTVAALAKGPAAILRPEDLEVRHSLYPEFPYEENAWGMVIDLNSCTNCNSCVVACQAENNIPAVGKDEVLRGRELHWIRIDTYHEGPADDPRRVHQPVLCMHCEKAPCEIVCPTAATAHSSEGLNQMVYNRCVGTRYCQNNCPYKVRRFNFFQYADESTPSIQNLYNPEVTVRERGVMEKCTYCVQRIVRTRIEAEKERRPIRDGEVKTACEQACPSQAIVFGDLAKRGSAVSKLKAGPRNYELLGELQTQPRTTYLARVRNPNPELERP